MRITTTVETTHVLRTQTLIVKKTNINKKTMPEVSYAHRNCLILRQDTTRQPVAQTKLWVQESGRKSLTG